MNKKPLPPLYGPFAAICYTALVLWTVKDLWLVALVLLGIIYLLLKIDGLRNR